MRLPSLRFGYLDSIILVTNTLDRIKWLPMQISVKCRENNSVETPFAPPSHPLRTPVSLLKPPASLLKPPASPHFVCDRPFGLLWCRSWRRPAEFLGLVFVLFLIPALLVGVAVVQVVLLRILDDNLPCCCVSSFVSLTFMKEIVVIPGLDSPCRKSTIQFVTVASREMRSSKRPGRSILWSELKAFEALSLDDDFIEGSTTSTLPAQDPDVPRRATSNHKGVHLRKKNGKYVARLCLPGGKSRKLELGEYNTQYEAARAYQVGAFYYNKSLSSTCEGDQSFLDSLPSVPDNLSDQEKLVWVRERARQSAATVDTSDRPGTSASRSVLAGSGCSSFEARPSTRSYGTQGSCGNYYSSTPASPAPTTPGSAAPDSLLPSYYANESHDEEMLWLGDFSDIDSCRLDDDSDWVLDDHHKRNSGAPDISNEIPGFKRRKSVLARSHGLTNVEVQQQVGDTSHLNTQTPVADHQAVPELKMTDSILFASCKLREQGWKWTLKSMSPSSVEAGVLFSVSQGQQAAPALLMTDIIINSFYELREQGWEVHLVTCDNIEVNNLHPHGFEDLLCVKFSLFVSSLIS